MDWKKLFLQLFDNSPQRSLPFKEIAQDVETMGKWGVAILGALYVIGLVIWDAYFSGLNIRSIELLKVRYLFVGFYFYFFTAAHLLVPHKYIKQRWLRIVYVFIFSFSLVWLDDVFAAYLGNLVNTWLIGKSYFRLPPELALYVVGSLLTLFAAALFLPVAFNITFRRFKQNKFGRVAGLIFLFFLCFEYGIFAHWLFPNIPEVMGGGKPPVVRLEFSNDAPYSVTNNFDVSKVAEYYKGVGPVYYAKLIYVDDSSVFLQEAFWYSKKVYELRREQVELLAYESINPVALERLFALPPN